LFIGYIEFLDRIIPKPESYGDSNYGLFDCFEMASVEEKNFGQSNAQSISTGQFHFSQEFFDGCPEYPRISRPLK